MSEKKRSFTDEEFDKLEPLIVEIARFASVDDTERSLVEFRPPVGEVRIDLDEETYDRLRREKEKFSTIHIEGKEPVLGGVKVLGLDSGIILLHLE